MNDKYPFENTMFSIVYDAASIGSSIQSKYQMLYHTYINLSYDYSLNTIRVYVLGSGYAHTSLSDSDLESILLYIYNNIDLENHHEFNGLLSKLKFKFYFKGNTNE